MISRKASRFVSTRSDLDPVNNASNVAASLLLEGLEKRLMFSASLPRTNVPLALAILNPSLQFDRSAGQTKANGDDGLAISYVPATRTLLKLGSYLSKPIAGDKLTVAMDSAQKVAGQYGVSGIPHTVIVGPDGKVAWVKTGYSPEGPAEAAEAIKKLLEPAAPAPAKPQ